ncbi:BgTH12-05968 [Blumeria graminis f. sp. triticale]|uniref:BgtAc-30169 n=3 Tax=Blumeria graminis TaxID=34373 RepID=A0A9X9MKP5_BLUGR|nr:hypothetical protein BGT96224_Ac30169 [Blumeria graminis f. sp. tritici 96224]CAD6504235.1 BgTH12-05968 [Blumeria graminis f. sp. triticale]VDB91050.1 BgtAc-30169 [Blumeria graminis f. sp. tritici]
MHCAFAFLLHTVQKWPVPNRLAITSSYGSESRYGIYRPKPGVLFPQPTEDLGIQMTESHVCEPGTYITAYCSKEYNPLEIWDSVIHGLDKVTDKSQLQFSKTSFNRNKCLESIHLLPSTSTEPNRFYLSDIILEKICTEEDIAHLAYHEKLSVEGNFGTFFSSQTSAGPRVVADRAVSMRNIVLNGEIFKRIEDAGLEMALAWYQGHLHIFSRYNLRKYWCLVTSIDDVSKNGAHISRYAVSYLNLLQNTLHIPKTIATPNNFLTIKLLPLLNQIRDICTYFDRNSKRIDPSKLVPRITMENLGGVSQCKQGSQP